MKCNINLSNTQIFTFFTLCIVIINTIDATSWDLVITIGEDVVFYYNNSTLVRTRSNQDINEISRIAYDGNSDKIFFSAVAKNDTTRKIFVDNLNSNETEINKIVDHVGSITKMIYDSLSHTLFWIDYFNQAILKMSINENMNTSKTEIIFNSTSRSPRGLAFDLCHTRLYWTNCDGYNSTIMSSNIDGTNSTIIVNDNLYDPIAITVDHFTGKIYWIDDTEGIHYKIERSNLDGTNREIFMSGKHQQPVQIATDNSRVYWIDWVHNAIWSKEKNATVNDQPIKWLSLEYYNDNDDQPTDILTHENNWNIDCKMMNTMKYEIFPNETENIEHHQNDELTLNIKDYNETIKLKQMCLNNGYYNETSEECQCTPGYYGKYCEQFPCQNYCLHGECRMTANDQVYCQCYSEYNGLRCEKHVCSDYCLNGGECSVQQGEPFCNCKFSQGNRCEDLYSIAEICLTHTDINQLQGSNRSEIDFNRDVLNEEFNEDYNSWIQIVMMILSTIITILTVLVIVLSYFVDKYRRRPQIKKAFIVKKTNVSPYTVSSEYPHSACDVEAIENCCNMSICETPCVELQMKNLSVNFKKTDDDRHSIINNMYGNHSSS